MLSKTAGKRLDIYLPNYVLFDLETTGTSSVRDQVIEISAVKVREGHVVDEFSTLVNPRMPIPFAATQVNKITDNMVKNSPYFEQAFAEFLKFAGNDVMLMVDPKKKRYLYMSMAVFTAIPAAQAVAQAICRLIPPV